jgi:hypothetical protein
MVREASEDERAWGETGSERKKIQEGWHGASHRERCDSREEEELGEGWGMVVDKIRQGAN